jgi:hypothetical protein
VCLPLMAACTRDQDPEKPEPPPPPKVATQALLPTAGPNLAPLLRRRLEYMFDAAALVAESWPLMTPQSTCLLVIDMRTQWVVNCELAPAGFELTGELFQHHAVYAHSGGTFESAGQELATAQLLAETPAAAHVPLAEHDARAGLPGEQPWLVIGTLEALSAFHPAFAHATTEAWVSVAIHELVHTHQLRAPGFESELRAIEQRKSDPSVLTRLYIDDARYRRLVSREYALLVSAALRPASDKTAAKRALRSWWSLYLERRRYLSRLSNAQHLIADDQLFTYVEGVARFVESDFLARRAQHPAESLSNDPRFHDYAAFLDKGYAASPNRQLDEQYVYALGYHVCELLERVDARWKNRVHARTHRLHDIVRELAADGGGG